MTSGERALSLRELNRAMLARQMLLEREPISVLEAVERLVGLQAQVPGPPYVGLWSRLRGFRRLDLTSLIRERRVVRATLMRSTLHLMTAEDYAKLRPALQPALTRSMNSACRKRIQDLDLERLIEAARVSFEKEPRTFAELRPVLSETEPERDPSALAYAVRNLLPLVQVPSGGEWGFPGNAPFTLAEPWLGRPLSTGETPRSLILRYLAAFGPASVGDFQTWSYMPRMREEFEELRLELRTFRDENGKELFDAPDAPLPDAYVPAPVRFVPDYDNLLLSHADRSRIIADEHRKKVFLSAARVRATFLVDGFVRGAWKIEKTKGAATLVIEAFEPLDKKTRDALAEEGERLVRFIREDAKSHHVRFE